MFKSRALANWILGLEYNYAAFETRSYQLAGAAPPRGVHLWRQAAGRSMGRRPPQLQVRRAGRREVL